MASAQSDTKLPCIPYYIWRVCTHCVFTIYIHMSSTGWNTSFIYEQNYYHYSLRSHEYMCATLSHAFFIYYIHARHQGMHEWCRIRKKNTAHSSMVIIFAFYFSTMCEYMYYVFILYILYNIKYNKDDTNNMYNDNHDNDENNKFPSWVH